MRLRFLLFRPLFVALCALFVYLGVRGVAALADLALAALALAALASRTASMSSKSCAVPGRVLYVGCRLSRRSNFSGIRAFTPCQ